MTIELLGEKSLREAYEAEASGLRLVPDFVARPASIEDVAEVMLRAQKDRIPVTTAGAQSSTTAASITDEGILLSMRGLNRIAVFFAEKETKGMFGI